MKKIMQLLFQTNRIEKIFFISISLNGADEFLGCLEKYCRFVGATIDHSLPHSHHPLQRSRQQHWRDLETSNAC